MLMLSVRYMSRPMLQEDPTLSEDLEQNAMRYFVAGFC